MKEVLGLDVMERKVRDLGGLRCVVEIGDGMYIITVVLRAKTCSFFSFVSFNRLEVYSPLLFLF